MRFTFHLQVRTNHQQFYQGRRQLNRMKVCTQRGFEIYDHLMNFDMNVIENKKTAHTA